MEIKDYLKADEHIDFTNKSIRQKADELFVSPSDMENIKTAYEFVRDEIRHSRDINSDRVTRCASEVLAHKEGLCLSKSMLLAALLRCSGIPAGLCYQRLVAGSSPRAGYFVHGLNAVFLSDEERWIRLDARGNKQNVNAQFSTENEMIAYTVRIGYGEMDFPMIYAKPPLSVIEALDKCKNPMEYSFDSIDL